MDNINVLHTTVLYTVNYYRLKKFGVRHALTQKSSEMHLVDDFSTAALMWPNNHYLQKRITKINLKKKKKD